MLARLPLRSGRVSPSEYHSTSVPAHDEGVSMRIARSWKVVAVLGVAATMALTACTQKSQSGGEAGGGSGGGGGGGPVKVAFVPKLQGVPYFEAMNAGGQKAAAALGNVQWLYQGPTQADAAAQADIVRSFIQQKVNTLIVAPNDPDSMAPLLQEAKAQGIGESLTDALLKPMGGQGKYAIVSCGQTAENLNSWIKVQKEYTATT